MSIAVMTLVFARSVGTVSKKAVLLAMADAANDDGSGVYKSAETIGNQCDLSKRSVFRAWDALEADGLIRRVGLRSVRGGDVIIWGLDCDAIARLPKPGDRMATLPDDNLSPGDELAPSDSVSPGDSVSSDPMTSCPKPDDSVSPEPSIEPSIEPSLNVETLLDGIWETWSAEGKKRSHSREQLIKKLKTKTKGEDLASVLKAFKAYAADQKPEFHHGIQVLLNSGQWKNYLAEPKAEEREPDQIPIEEWRRAQRAYIEFEAWPREQLGPAPHEPGCRAPESTLRIIASRLNAHRYHKDILRNLSLEAAA
jgi:hypothetical protein